MFFWFITSTIDLRYLNNNEIITAYLDLLIYWGNGVEIYRTVSSHNENGDVKEKWSNVM